MPRHKQGRRGEKPQYRSRMKAYVARVWELDGSCSGWTDLGTDNFELATALYERWLATGEKPETERGKERFEKAAERVLTAAEQRAGSDRGKLQAVRARRARLRTFALPRIGLVEVGRIQANHVASVLDAMAAADDKAGGTILKMRSDISQILAVLVREGAVKDNCARSLPAPKDAREDTRERMTLSDAQLLEFQRQRGFTTQLDMLAMTTRGIAGQRPSDAHASVWEDIDTVSFAWMRVRRPKTDGAVGKAVRGGRKARAYEKVVHEIDELYRAPWQAYWVAQGRPISGPVFPTLRDGVTKPMKLKDGRAVARRPSQAGSHRAPGSSYAQPLRDAVWACRIYSPLPGFDPAAPDKRLCRFQTDTDETRRLDFYGLRGALVTALADAGVETATQLAITGHTQLTTQLQHYMGRRRVRVPRAALPGGGAGGGVLSDSHPESSPSRDTIPRFGMERPHSGSRRSAKSSKLLAAPVGFEPTTNALGMQRKASRRTQGRVTTERVVAAKSPSSPVSSHDAGGNDSRSALLADMAKAALAEDWETLDRLRAALQVIDGPRKPLATVLSLTQPRKRLR